MTPRERAIKFMEPFKANYGKRLREIDVADIEAVIVEARHEAFEDAAKLAESLEWVAEAETADAMKLAAQAVADAIREKAGVRVAISGDERRYTCMKCGVRVEVGHNLCKRHG